MTPPEPAELDWDDADDMCPNCVTPWKCNGPHLQTVASRRAALTAATSPESRLVAMLKERHELVCACPFDGTDPGCNLALTGAQLGALLLPATATEETP